MKIVDFLLSSQNLQLQFLVKLCIWSCGGDYSEVKTLAKESQVQISKLMERPGGCGSLVIPAVCQRYQKKTGWSD